MGSEEILLYLLETAPGWLSVSTWKSLCPKTKISFITNPGEKTDSSQHLSLQQQPHFHCYNDLMKPGTKKEKAPEKEQEKED